MCRPGQLRKLGFLWMINDGDGDGDGDDDDDDDDNDRIYLWNLII